MTVQIDTTAENNGIRLVTQGTHPSAPSSGHVILYHTTGTANPGLYMEDSSGNKYGAFITGTSGMNFIQQINPTGSPTGTFSDIPQGYTALKVLYYARSTTAATSTSPAVYYNQDYTAGNYRRTIDYGVQTGAGSEGGADATIGAVISAANAPANSFSSGEITIPFYANSVGNKELYAIGSHRRDATTLYMLTFNSSHEWFSTNPINRIDVVLAAGNYVTGTVFRLYGIV